MVTWTIGEMGVLKSFNPNLPTEAELEGALIDFVKFMLVVDFVMSTDGKKCFVWEMDYKGFAQWGWYSISNAGQAGALGPSIGAIQLRRLDYSKNYWYRKEGVSHAV